MAITRDTESTREQSSVSTPSIASHTISANALVLAWFFRESATAPSATATFNGNSMTLLTSATEGTAGMWCYYYEASEGAGSYTVQGNWAGAADSYTYVESLTGVASGAPEAYDAATTATGASATVGGGTWDFGSVSANAFVASFMGNPLASPTFSSVTVVTQENDFGTLGRALTGFLNGTAGSEVPPLWTLSGAVGDKIAIAVSVAAAAAGTTLGGLVGSNTGLLGQLAQSRAKQCRHSRRTDLRCNRVWLRVRRV
jgi:hypothetical protein